ncbi:E3 ubiquitin-protein ligase CHFR [Thecamonas trahens ATCC 50062]|uniref:E3 ubiquitin-protein ligase CHFR n=1 Tax=Thecamonas trahens ATCC 50062 TaxID=461836 RepID=A0A0L0DDV0_THETB|nr:E3 ubiquitin-protein ligase CHFR [Thecamonas trahens ATCC 50062]KNC50321.1 E3 ubiquitin-protein ligase CHFR [Thecamonas trahens ATCC 50062]|eukprot:XP_013756867.1 E3 ubiquitin-protein ligase CHFR [Thecamonas trahens ATCC 50062]
MISVSLMAHRMLSTRAMSFLSSLRKLPQMTRPQLVLLLFGGGGGGGGGGGNAVADATPYAELLTCSICQEIMHKAMALVPCMHNFCAGCYAQWAKNSHECPMCRATVSDAADNHTIRNLVEAFLKDHPDQARNADELAALDRAAKSLVSRRSPPTSPYRSRTAAAAALHLHHGHDEYDEYDEYEGEALPGSSAHPSGHAWGGLTFAFGAPPVPAAAGVTSSTASSAAPPRVSNTQCRECRAPGSSGHQCSGSDPTHLTCSVCLELLPKRTDEAGYDGPAIQCALCLTPFCDLYWGCRSLLGQGALRALGSWEFPRLPAHVLWDNLVEIKFLNEYMASASLSVDGLWQAVLGGLSAGSYTYSPDGAGPAVGITEATATCHGCASNVFRDLIPDYLMSLPRSALPANATSRPNCHWGSACRTQSRSVGHAKRYNHVCEQTKFA